MTEMTIRVLSLKCNELAERGTRWPIDLAKMRLPFDSPARARGEYPFLAFEVERPGIWGALGRCSL